MFHYNYFIKKVPVLYTYRNTFHCIRVPEGDIRNVILTVKYLPIGFHQFVTYPQKPSEEDEIFQLRKRFQQWSDDFVIEDVNDKK